MPNKNNYKYLTNKSNLKTHIDLITQEQSTQIEKFLYFFVLNCPSGYSQTYPTSIISKKFNEYGIASNEKLKKLNEIKKLFGDNYFSFEFSSEVDRYTIDRFVESIKKSKEFLCIQEDRYCSIFDSIYYKIRNAFSHGSFYICEDFYIMWNLHNNHIKGLFVLKKSTLDWLHKLIVNGIK